MDGHGRMAVEKVGAARCEMPPPAPLGTKLFSATGKDAKGSKEAKDGKNGKGKAKGDHRSQTCHALQYHWLQGVIRFSQQPLSYNLP